MRPLRCVGCNAGSIPALCVIRQEGSESCGRRIGREWNGRGRRVPGDDLESHTLREIATRKVSLDSVPFIGTPQRVADSLARTIEAVGGDGFAIRQGLWPGYVGPFVEQVVPLLQQRGVARAEYAGTTLREHLQEF